MEKIEHRAVIKFFVLEGLTASEIHSKMVKVLKGSAPSFSTVHRWALEFKRGRTSIEDDARSGRPKSASTSEIIERIHEIVHKDPSVTTREIAETVVISDERVRHILKEDLNMKKVFGKVVPHSLTIQQKLHRKQICEHHLDRFKKNKTDFKRRFITMDETWIYHHDPKLKRERLQWTETGCSAPKQQKREQTVKKVMASVFWDAKGILLIDYLEKGKTINSEYYTTLLDQLDVMVREKRPSLRKKKIIFNQDNARVHTSALSMAKIKELKYDLLEQPPYSPDLAPSDFYLFRNLKQFLRGKRFSSNAEAIAAVNQYFADLPETHFRHGIELLEKNWTKCVELLGDYVQ